MQEDLVLGGRKIAAGERLCLVNCAANRDPERFDRPHELDVTRSPNVHLALSRVFERLPGLALAPSEEPEWVPSLAARALRRLPVVHERFLRL